MRMGRSFIHDLYYGRVTPWERKRARSLAYAELDRRIDCKREQFIQGLSDEALQDFKKWEELCDTRQEQERIESFRLGVQIGARFMEEVCQEEETRISY